MRSILVFVTCFIYSLNTFATEAQVKRRYQQAPHQNKRTKVAEQVMMNLDSPYKPHAAPKSDFPTSPQEFKTQLSENPLEFIDLLGDWAPSSLDPEDPHFQAFYQETFKIIRPYDSFSGSGSDAWRLANILLQLETCLHVGFKVEEHIKSEVNAEREFEDEIRSAIWQQLGSKNRREIKDSVFDKLSDGVKNDLFHKVWNEVYKQMNELKRRFEDQVDSGLKQFELEGIDENADVDEAIKPAIKYLTVIYNWGGLALWHSDAFEKLHRELADQITNSMKEQEIKSSLQNLKIPHHPEYSYTITAPVSLISSMALPKEEELLPPLQHKS